MEDITAGRFPAPSGGSYCAAVNQGNTATFMKAMATVKHGDRLERHEVPEAVFAAFPRDHYEARVNGSITEIMGPDRECLRLGDTLTCASQTIFVRRDRNQDDGRK